MGPALLVVLFFAALCVVAVLLRTAPRDVARPAGDRLRGRTPSPVGRHLTGDADVVVEP